MFNKDLLKKIKKTNRSFMFVVVIPVLIAVLYYGLIASDVYSSESQFIVRSSKPQGANVLGMMLGGSFSNSLGDSYSVNTFISSWDALAKIKGNVNLLDVYGNRQIDIFSRFPGVFWWEHSDEEFLMYYKKHIGTLVDSTTGISTLKVSAYRSQDAFKINQLLLDMAEKHVNKLNERARRDMIQYAMEELQKAEMDAKRTSKALEEFQRNSSSFNAAQFERLTLEKAISLKQLEARHASLIQANDDARRQFLYLERVVEPHQPDDSLEPQRLYRILTVLVTCLIAWGVFRMFVAGVREHHD